MVLRASNPQSSWTAGHDARSASRSGPPVTATRVQIGDPDLGSKAREIARDLRRGGPPGRVSVHHNRDLPTGEQPAPTPDCQASSPGTANAHHPSERAASMSGGPSTSNTSWD